jgi:chemotaxis protein MotB
MRLLVAESDAALGAFLCQGLEAENYGVEVALDGVGALESAASQRHDLLILDLNLPQLDGLEVLRQLRARQAGLPILILTNKSRVEDRVRAFDEGADDFLLMPFAFTELSARVRALLRRGGRGAEPVLRADDLELDRLARIVRRGGRRIELTPKEYGLLEFLMTHMGQRVTRPMIIENVWNFSGETMTNVVDVYINYSSSQVDKRRVGQLSLAIQVAFQQMGIFDASNTKAAVANSEPMPFSNVQIVENVQRLSTLGQIVSSPHGSLSASPEPNDLNQLRKELQTALQIQIAKHEISLTPTREGLVVSLREAGFYGSGSAQLKPGTAAVLDQFVAIVAPRAFRLRIEGHTDNVPIHSSQFQSNWELSTARATQLVKIFITRYGISPDRLAASGYAEFHPVATNDTAEGRAMNRRVDLVILNSPGASVSGESPADLAAPSPSPQP